MRLVITCLFCFSIALVCGQVTQPARFEIEEKHGANSPLLIGMKEKGIAFFQDKDKIKERKNQWDLILLDTLLQEKHRKEVWLELKLKLVGYDFLASHLFFLFREGDTHLNNLILLKINVETFEEKSYTIKQQVEFRLSHFSMLSDAAVFGGYIGNEPAVILFDTEKENLKILPGFFLTNNELLDVRVNKNNTFNVLLVDRGNKESKKIVLRTYDSKGTQLLEDIIDIPQGKTIISGITSGLDRDELLIVGGWGSEKSKMANGIFSLLVDPFEKQEIQFYRFSELKHSFDYMNPKRAERIRNRELENQKKERKPVFKNLLNVVKLEENAAGFVVLAEMHSAFAPSGSYANPYYNSSQSFYSPYSSRYTSMPFPYYSNRQMGEQVFHSLVVAFNHQGKLVNDYGLPLDNIKLTSLDQVTDFVPIPTGLAQAYKKESNLILHIHEANDLSTLDTVAVQLNKPSDKLKFESTEDDGIRSWYKNVFYTWGYCTLKDTDKPTDATRNVFYVNKVKVK